MSIRVLSLDIMSDVLQKKLSHSYSIHMRHLCERLTVFVAESCSLCVGAHIRTPGLLSHDHSAALVYK